MKFNLSILMFFSFFMSFSWVALYPGEKKDHAWIEIWAFDEDNPIQSNKYRQYLFQINEDTFQYDISFQEGTLLSNTPNNIHLDSIQMWHRLQKPISQEKFIKLQTQFYFFQQEDEHIYLNQQKYVSLPQLWKQLWVEDDFWLVMQYIQTLVYQTQVNNFGKINMERYTDIKGFFQGKVEITFSFVFIPLGAKTTEKLSNYQEFMPIEANGSIFSQNYLKRGGNIRTNLSGVVTLSDLTRWIQIDYQDWSGDNYNISGYYYVKSEAQQKAYSAHKFLYYIIKKYLQFDVFQ